MRRQLGSFMGMAALMALVMDGMRGGMGGSGGHELKTEARKLGTKWIANPDTLTVEPFVNRILWDNEILVYGDTEKQAIKNLKLKLKHG